ncbi:unnamed protein product [Closterium sp. NIES-53]
MVVSEVRRADVGVEASVAAVGVVEAAAAVVEAAAVVVEVAEAVVLCSARPGIEAAALGASASAAPGTGEFAAPGAGESALSGTAPTDALHIFTLDSGASRYFFRDSTTLTPLSRPVAVSLADPSGDPVLAHSSTVLPCPAAPSGLLSGLRLPSFSTNLVSGADLQDAWVAACGQVFSAASRSSPASAPCSCHTRLSFGTTALVTPPCLVFEVWPPVPLSRVSPGPSLPFLRGHERYFLLVVDDYSRDTTVFPLRRKDRGGEFSSDLLRAFCRAEGIRQKFTLPASPQQNGFAGRRIGMVMDVACRSMIHAAAPHFMWPFAVQYAAHQINLQPCVSLPGTTPTPRWMGKVGDASVFRVWGSRAFVRDASADKLSSCAVPCVFLGFPLDAPEWQIYHPTLRRVLSSQDVTFDESVSYYHHVEPVEVALDSGASRGAEFAGAGTGGVGPGVAEHGGAEPGGAESGGAEPVGVKSGSAEPGGAKPERAESGGPPGVPSRREPLSPQQLREWYTLRCYRAAGAGAARGASGAAGGASGAGGAGGAAGAGAAGGAAGAGAAGGAAGAGAAGGTAGAGAAGGSSAGGTGAIGAARGARAAGPGVARTGGTGAAGAGGASRVGAVGAGAVATGGTARVGAVGVTGAGGAAGVVPGDPGAEGTGLTELREPELRPASPESCSVLPVRAVRTGRRVPRQRPPTVLSTHSMTLRPSTAPQHVPLPSPPASSLPDGLDPESDSLRAASPIVMRFLTTAVTDPSFESTATSALVAKLVDFAVACRLDYTASLVAESASASVYPPSDGGECALGTDILEDRQEEFECFAAAIPHLVSMLLAAEGDPDAPIIPTPRSYAEAIEGPYSSQCQREGVDFFQTFSPTPKMTTLRVLSVTTSYLRLTSVQPSYRAACTRRSGCFTGSFPAGTQWSLRRPVYGLRQAPREWHDTLRMTLAALGFAPSTADPSLLLCADTTLPPFYDLVYVDDLVFANADTEALAHVKSELQKRHTCTDLGELTSYLGLRITRDRAQPTITLTQSHMVQQVLQRFGFTYSSPQSTPLPTGHSLSAPPSDESVEPSGPYPELVGCLMYPMTCTRPDLAYPLSLLACYVAPGRHRKVHWDSAKRVLRYLCSTSGMGLVLGGWAQVVLTGHADASWVDDLAMQRSSQGYTFSLGSESVSWRSTRSSSVLSSSCEAEIYGGAMAAQELRWLTYLLTDLGEAPRSPPVMYVNNKAMLALCQEHRQEHRTKHISLRYFLARELQQRGQLRLAYVASQANLADVFTKALQPCDHQPCFVFLDWSSIHSFTILTRATAAATARATVAARGGAAASAGGATSAGGAAGAARSAGGAAGSGDAGPATDRHCLSLPLSRQLQQLGVDSSGQCRSRTTPPISSFQRPHRTFSLQRPRECASQRCIPGCVKAIALGSSESAAAPGAGESAAALGARESADALGASASTATGPASAEALHTFTLDSGASRCFFCECTTVTPLAAPVPVLLADPTGGPIVARASTVLPCPAVPSRSLSCLPRILDELVEQRSFPG